MKEEIRSLIVCISAAVPTLVAIGFFIVYSAPAFFYLGSRVWDFIAVYITKFILLF